MAKITLTEEEEIMYLRELDKIQDMMPDLEIQILAHPMPYNGQSFHADNSTGSEFRTFLHTQSAAQSFSAPAKA